MVAGLVRFQPEERNKQSKTTNIMTPSKLILTSLAMFIYLAAVCMTDRYAGQTPAYLLAFLLAPFALRVLAWFLEKTENE